MKWEQKNYNYKYLSKKAYEFKENRLITSLLLNRNITTKKEVDKFLNSNKEDFHDPFLFEDMNKVVDRILKAKEKNEKITIYGDYDVDGISATAYLVIVLRKLGIRVDYYTPSRSHEGTTITSKMIEVLQKRGTKLFITVDTSIATREEVLMLKKIGLDIIITDHHHKNEKIKEFNIPTINPKTSDNYPNKNLAGVGVAFKVACAVYQKAGISEKILFDYLDIVMIGTVADVVPMVDENRIIIKKGLANLQKSKVKGMRYILNYLKINSKNITTNEIGFYIAPIFNALGRIDKSRTVVEFFIQEDDYRLFSIIEDMKKANKVRRYLEMEIYNEIEEKIQKLKNPKYIFMKSRVWHSGVIGVVCSRISMKYNIPVILISIKNGLGKASCRSIDGLNIFEILKETSHKFERFGGHDLAAGFLIAENQLKDVENFLKRKLSEANKTTEEKVLSIDTDLSIEQINKNKLLDINKLAPFGLDNQEPNFKDMGIKFISFQKFGVNNRHFKGFIKKNDRIISVIGYNLGQKLKVKNIHKTFEIVYTPVFKSGRSDLYIELKIKDFK